ncbi:hypothetical protein ACFYNY_34650 [Streptomyces sp. NPDC006530]|uniref:hypothetical protein n=1 Tax=Streptomyces sp. NPDC006530 TaxID=3364750 RepID=UPI0036788876
MGHQRSDAVTDRPESGPDYGDLSNTAVAYRWVPRKEGQAPENRQVFLTELATVLAAHAAERGARLVGKMAVDFPEFRKLPRFVRRGLLRAMWRQERWWRFGDLVLVRAWQHTEPPAPGSTAGPAPQN